MLTALRESADRRRSWNPALNDPLQNDAIQGTGETTMKSLIALTAIAAFTVGSGVAGKQSALATDKAIARNATQPVLMAAKQELPFDRRRSN